jgi:HD-like signal output (HDOD) protein
VKPMTVDEILDGVMDLIPLPKAYLRLRELVLDPNSSLTEITQVIANDPGLTSRILRIANSAQFALPSRIDTVAQAVQMLGLNQVHCLAMASATSGSLSRLEPSVLDIHEYWRRSIYAAVVARIVSGRIGLRRGERLFVAGLLHAVGELVLAFKEPILFEEFRIAATREERTLAAIQRDALGFDYADVSAELLSRWQLPPELVQPVRHHAAGFASVPAEFREDASVLQVAAVIARAAMWRSAHDEPVPEFEAVALVVTELDEAATELLMSEADQQVVEAMTLLLPEPKTGLRSRATA